MAYTIAINDDDDIYLVEEFKKICYRDLFIDYDGYGHPVKEKLYDESIVILPSQISKIPKDATHIVWYNR